MSILENVSQEDIRYKLAPHITLGDLKGSLVAFKGQYITKIDGEGIVDFIEEIFEYLVRKNGTSIRELDKKFVIKKDELKEVFEFLVENKLCIKSETDFNSTAFLVYDRAGGQVKMEDILSRIETSTVEVIANKDNILAKKFIEELQSVGINTALKGEISDKPSIRVAIGTSHLDLILDDVNNNALNDHIPWLSLVPYDGETAWVGPFITPYQSACLHCYNLRKSANFSDDVFRSKLMNIKPIKDSSHPVYNQAINLVQIGIASNLITEWIALREYAPSAVPGGFTTITLDNKGISTDNHRTYRVPRCQKCSPVADTGFPQVWHHGEVKENV